MVEKDKNFEEKEDQTPESTFEVTELDDEGLEDVSGGTFTEPTINENCAIC